MRLFLLCLSLVEGIKHHRSRGSFLLGKKTTESTDASSVMICTGGFFVRRSVCSAISDATKDVIPTETLVCTKPLTTGEVSDVFSGSSESLKLDFTSHGALQLSLGKIDRPNKVLVSYGDCNSVSSFPDLEEGATYFAIIVLDNHSAKDSVVLNSQSVPGSARVDMMNPLNILDVQLFSDSTLAAKLSADFMTCQSSSTSPCSPSTMFNPQVVRVPSALVELDKWF
jgi:hypothetical protein